VAASTAHDAAPDHPARARCPTRHPCIIRRALAGTCRQDMGCFFARKEGKHSQPIAA
jgi:hypothetical protein